MARLVYQDRASRQQQHISLNEDNPTVIVGRHKDCDIQISEGSVSRRHSEFTYSAGKFWVRDLGSSNGTFVNKNEVKKEANKKQLSDGDEIRCGNFPFELVFDDTDRAPRGQSGYNPRGRGGYPSGSGYSQQPPPPPAQSNYNSAPPYRSSSYDKPPASPPPLSSSTQRPVSAPPGNYNRGGYPRPPQQTPSASGNYPAGQLGAPTYRSGYDHARPSTTPKPYSPSSAPAAKPAVAPYKSPAQAISAPPLPTIPPPISGESHAGQSDVKRLQDEVASLSTENQRLSREKLGLRAELDAALRKAAQSDRLHDLERELNQKETIIENLQESYNRLKTQSEGQLAQLDKYRNESHEKRETIENLEEQCRTSDKIADQNRVELEEVRNASTDLKVRINQLERQLSEHKRNTKLANSEHMKLQQKNEELQAMFAQQGNQSADIAQELNKLRDVLDFKEAELIERTEHIEEIEMELDSYRNGDDVGLQERERLNDQLELREERISNLEAQVQTLKQSLEDAPDPSSLVDQQELDALRENCQLLEDDRRQLRRELSDVLGQLESVETPAADPDAEARLTAQVDTLNRELETLRARPDNSGQLEELRTDLRRVREQVDTLSQQNTTLTVQLEARDQQLAESTGAGPVADPLDDEDRLELQRLKRENRRLQDDNATLHAELEDLEPQASSSAPSVGHDSGLIARTEDLAMDLNDRTSQMRNNIQLMKDYIAEIRRIYEAIRRADINQLSTLDRVRLEKTIREVEPEVTFEELTRIVGECSEDSDALKRTVISFKETL